MYEDLFEEEKSNTKQQYGLKQWEIDSSKRIFIGNKDNLKHYLFKAFYSLF